MHPDDIEDETEMHTHITWFTPEGMAEIAAALDAPPPDTPERRRAFELARQAKFLVDQVLAQEEESRNREG